MKVTIWHNPRCSKSRQTLQILQDHNIEPEIFDYQKIPPGEAEISRVLGLLTVSPQDLVRKGESVFKELQLDNASDPELIAAMVANPVLIERPIVEANGKAALGRPPEKVLEIL